LSSLSLALALALSHSLSLSHSLIVSLSLVLSLTLTHSLSLSLSLSLARYLSLVPRSLFLSLSLSLSLSRYLFLVFLALSRTRSLTLSLPPTRRFVSSCMHLVFCEIELTRREVRAFGYFLRVFACDRVASLFWHAACYLSSFVFDASSLLSKYSGGDFQSFFDVFSCLSVSRQWLLRLCRCEHPKLSRRPSIRRRQRVDRSPALKLPAAVYHRRSFAAIQSTTIADWTI